MTSVVTQAPDFRSQTTHNTSLLPHPSIALTSLFIPIHRRHTTPTLHLFISILPAQPPATPLVPKTTSAIMAPIASASPFRPRSRAATRNSPSPPPVPPKTTTSKAIDLSSSTTSTDRATVSKITRRAVVCDVVVERDGEETTTLLAQLGHTVDPLTALPPLPQPPLTPSRKSQESDSDLSAYSGWTASKRDEMEKRLQSLIEEFVRTEKSYISRIKALKTVRLTRTTNSSLPG